MASYAELNARPACDFLDASNFRTGWDSLAANVNRAEERYRDGLETGRKAKVVFVSRGGTWGSDNRDGSYTSSYEGIGYHANTADFWRGVLDSGCEVVIYREDGKHRIK